MDTNLKHAGVFLRQRAGFSGFGSASDLARALGCQRSTVHYWFAGVTRPSERLFEVLARVLDLTDHEKYLVLNGLPLVARD